MALNMDENYNEDFSGVFYFTNPTKNERKYLWNNREYSFPPESTVPLVILSEPLENIQEIRKRFALRMAWERFFEGEVLPTGQDYNKMKEMGGGMPPTIDEKLLEPFVAECLKPLPIRKGTVRPGKSIDDEKNYKSTKAIGKDDNPSYVFAEDNKKIPTYGEMPDR